MAEFYVCAHCGNQIMMVKNVGVPVVCCGERMKLLIPNTVEASGEKHIPVITVDGNKVKVNVGSVAHPMVDVHYIEWIYLETEKGGQMKALKPDESPEASFCTGGDKPVAAYAYCNLHGLWETKV